eukprot:13748922-Alexandrium_andersonii.AAC.1
MAGSGITDTCPCCSPVLERVVDRSPEEQSALTVPAHALSTPACGHRAFQAARVVPRSQHKRSLNG